MYLKITDSPLFSPSTDTTVRGSRLALRALVCIAVTFVIAVIAYAANQTAAVAQTHSAGPIETLRWQATAPAVLTGPRATGRTVIVVVDRYQASNVAAHSTADRQDPTTILPGLPQTTVTSFTTRHGLTIEDMYSAGGSFYVAHVHLTGWTTSAPAGSRLLAAGNWLYLAAQGCISPEHLNRTDPRS